MAEGYRIPATDALGMLGDAHSTNWAENREFFLNQNNPTNFERICDTAYYLYKRIGAIASKVAFDQVMDFSIIQKLGKEPKYASQKDEYQVQFAPTAAATIQAESRRDPHQHRRHPLLPQHLGPAQEGRPRTSTARTVEELYDPNVDFVLEEIGKLAGQFGAARIVIEGHTDGSMQGQVPAELGQGAVAEPRQRGEGGAASEVPDAAAQPVRVRRHGLGPAGRPDDPRTTPRTAASRSRSTRPRRRSRE